MKCDEVRIEFIKKKLKLVHILHILVRLFFLLLLEKKKLLPKNFSFTRNPAYNMQHRPLKLYN